MINDKTLILVRHAKSSWRDASLNDIERPLNKKGSKDAPKMGKHMARLELVPEVIYSSPGLRALSTARLISAELEIKPSDIKIDEDIYTFNRDNLLQVVQSLSDKHQKVMIVGHNPAITELTNYLAGCGIDNIPTCGIAVLKFPPISWKKIGKKKAVLASFDYPKKLW